LAGINRVLMHSFPNWLRPVFCGFFQSRCVLKLSKTGPGPGPGPSKKGKKTGTGPDFKALTITGNIVDDNRVCMEENVEV
jgi:hypothetical protein